MSGPNLGGLRDQTSRNGDLKFLAQIQHVCTLSISKTLPQETFSGLQISPECFCGCDSAPDLAGEVHSAPPDPIAGLREGRGGKRRAGKRRAGKRRAGKRPGSGNMLPDDLMGD